MYSNPEKKEGDDWKRYGWKAKRAELRSIAEYEQSLLWWSSRGRETALRTTAT